MVRRVSNHSLTQSWCIFAIGDFYEFSMHVFHSLFSTSIDWWWDANKMWQHLLPFLIALIGIFHKDQGGDCKLNDWGIDLFIYFNDDAFGFLASIKQWIGVFFGLLWRFLLKEEVMMLLKNCDQGYLKGRI